MLDKFNKNGGKMKEHKMSNIKSIEKYGQDDDCLKDEIIDIDYIVYRCREKHRTWEKTFKSLKEAKAYCHNNSNLTFEIHQFENVITANEILAKKHNLERFEVHYYEESKYFKVYYAKNKECFNRDTSTETICDNYSDDEFEWCKGQSDWTTIGPMQGPDFHCEKVEGEK